MRPSILLLAGLLTAGPGLAFDQAACILTVDPPVAVVGQSVNVSLTISDTGANAFTNVVPTLTITEGNTLVQLTYFSGPSTSITIAAGGSFTYTWTYQAVGQGEIHFRGEAVGNINSSGYSVSSSVMLLVPGPTAPALRILNNHLRPGKAAVIVILGRPGAAASVLVYDQAGAPLGPVVPAAVTLDGGGNGSARFTGVVAGRRLSPGLYWIVVTGGAASRAPLLVTDR